MKFFSLMRKLLPIFLFLLSIGYSIAQTKVSGQIFDEENEPVAYATVLFKGSIEGTISDETEGSTSNLKRAGVN